MSTQLDCGRRLPAVVCFVVLLLSGSTLNLQAQASGAVTQNATVKAPAFDIVSIKPADPNEKNFQWNNLPNGLDYTDMPLAPLIYAAYGIALDSQISGLPEWAKTDHYVISLRMDDETVAALKTLSSKEQWKQQQLMLQAMFANRCQLKMRREVKVPEVYDLVIAKGGIKMREAAPDEKELGLMKSKSWWSDAGPGDARTITATTHAGTADDLARMLASHAGRVIVDKTALGDKKFDYEPVALQSSGRAARPQTDAGQRACRHLRRRPHRKAVGELTPPNNKH